MFNRLGLDRFKKAESAEPFNFANAAEGNKKDNSITSWPQPLVQPQASADIISQNRQATSTGGGASTWQPPEWSSDPKTGVFVLEVMKEGAVSDVIPLDRKYTIFGRQATTCHLVLDHPSVSRQHAAVVHHRNGSVYVIDLGSVHGTFVSNERLLKDNPVELEVGQSMRFAASTRSYVLRNISPPTKELFPSPTPGLELLTPPDPQDAEAVLAYNTSLNRMGIAVPAVVDKARSLPRPEGQVASSGGPVKMGDAEGNNEPALKKARRAKVSFRDDYGGDLALVVGVSDGVDVGTEPGPIGVKEGSSLVGKFDSLVQTTIIPRVGASNAGRGSGGSTSAGTSSFAGSAGQKEPAVSNRLKQYLQKARAPEPGGLYGDLLGGSQPGGFAGSLAGGFAGGSWSGRSSDGPTSIGASSSVSSAETPSDTLESGQLPGRQNGELSDANAALQEDEGDEDLFGDKIVVKKAVNPGSLPASSLPSNGSSLEVHRSEKWAGDS